MNLSRSAHSSSQVALPGNVARIRRRLTLGSRDNEPMIELAAIQADVTKLEFDAITNAANTELRHGGGVAAAIARAGGPEVRRESSEKAPIGLGEAVETTAG